MTATLGLAFLIAFLVLEILATIGVPSPARFNLMAAGLACLAAAMLFGHITL